jgi:hypothetical protein
MVAHASVMSLPQNQSRRQSACRFTALIGVVAGCREETDSRMGSTRDPIPREHVSSTTADDNTYLDGYREAARC